MESLERKPDFNIQNSLEKVHGVSDVKKLELNPLYFEWAKSNLPLETFEAIKNNYESVEAYNFKYLSDGLSIGGYLWAPRGMTQPLPITVWNRGGTREFGSIGDKDGKQGPVYLDIPCELAKQGTVVVASEYRGGLDSEGKDEWGGADLNDVKRIKEIADQLPICKSGKAVVAGQSRGGMMSYLLASKEPWVKAVISLAGTTDLQISAKERPEMYEVFKESFGGSEEEMKKRSATHFYDEIPKDLPILIMHGSADDRVSVEQARKLNEILSMNNYNVEYHEFSDLGHDIGSFESSNKKETSEIINRFLKEQIY